MTTLRRYQVEAVEAVTSTLAGGGRTQLIAACGTGKTLMALRTALRLTPPDGLVAVACPSLPLLSQTLQVWAEEQAAGSALAVCGDKTVGDAPVRAGDLPCPVTRSPAEVAEWVRRAGRGRRLLVTTHRSADLAGAGLRAAGVNADLLVIDEAHRTAGQRTKHSAVLHDDHRLPAVRRLYQTATPRYLTTPSTVRDEALVGMDDTNVFGPVGYAYPFGKAIADGYLDDYQVAVIGVSRPEVLQTLRELDHNAMLDLDTAPLRTAVVQTALARAAAQWDLRRVIAFTPQVATAREFATTLPRTLRVLPDRPARPVTARYVHGRMTVAQRDAVLDDLRKPPGEGWTVVANARCLTEGVDVPAVDGVLFTAPKDSSIEVIQAVGRALRRNPEGSGVATVIVPVLLPDGPDESAGIDDQDDYRTLWQVVRALRAHDETLGAELDHHRIRASGGGAVGSAPDLPPRVLVRAPDGYDIDHYLQHVTVRLLEQTTDQWLNGYAAACQFHAEHGHLRVSEGVRVNGMLLGPWLSKQRTAYHSGVLAAERVAHLERIAMVWDSAEEFWQAALAAACSYHADHGHLRVPVGTRVDGIDLAAWLARQRVAYRAGSLPPERVAHLGRIAMVWDSAAEQWQVGLAAARAYHAQHGHLRMSRGTFVDGIDLEVWLEHKRRDYRRGVLTAERVAALEQLGIVWDQREQRWQAGLAAARAYHAQHGHLHVSEGTMVQGVDLHWWLAYHRTHYRKGSLSGERTETLNELGMVWDQREQRWQAGLAAARAYHAQHGHLHVEEGTCVNGIDLDRWLGHKREQRRRGKLSPERAQALDELGIQWNPRGERWERAVAAARRYRDQHGHLQVPPGTIVDGIDLAKWVTNQRLNYRRRSATSPQRRRVLEELGIALESG